MLVCEGGGGKIKKFYGLIKKHLNHEGERANMIARGSPKGLLFCIGCENMAEIKYLDVDISDLERRIDVMKLSLSEANAKKMLHDTCVDTAKKANTMVAREVVKDYAVTQKWVKSGIGQWKNEGTGNIGCIIPLTGKRGIIGGTFGASGGVGKGKRRLSRITARILKAKQSTLPKTMDHQGGNPPFRAKVKGPTFTRRLPIARVAGLSVPQMPLNQSKPKVENALHDYMAQRLEKHFLRYMK